MELSMKKTSKEGVTNEGKKKDDPTRKFGGLYGDTCKSRAPSKDGRRTQKTRQSRYFMWPSANQRKKEEYNTFVDINEKETGIISCLLAGPAAFTNPKEFPGWGGLKKISPASLMTLIRRFVEEVRLLKFSRETCALF
jgi:hypothetical protein